jgi:murein DD-endopeptidase
MIKRLLASGVFVLFLTAGGLSQTHSGFPVDIIAGPSPQPVIADGRFHLLYELHLTNFAPLPIELTGIDVLGAGTSVLASYRGQTLEKMVVPVERLSLPESPSESGGTRAIGEGHTVIIFIDLTLDSGARRPAELHHRFSFSVPRRNKATIERTLTGPTVSVVRDLAPVLRAPLRGSAWVAFNALGAEDHRRSLNAVDGQERIPQRFAIDWMRLGPDGRLFHGDGKSNANFYGYGAEVLAVADGRISDLKDGLPDNIGSTERSARDITLENAFGNYLILDLGQGRFAAYAHLQPGSLKVQLGDRVKSGQVLALLGNSGNSDAPHLHFQLANANSPMGSEGIPYELDTFTLLGMVPEDPAVQDDGGVLLHTEQEKPVVRRREFPLNNAAVTLP